MGEMTRREVAELLGISTETLSAYVSRGQAPAPARRIESTPLWDEEEVRKWHAQRPGRGGRGRPGKRARSAEGQDKPSASPDGASSKSTSAAAES
jgi:predicted DNA-binding transcriptional regulator AlpA